MVSPPPFSFPLINEGLAALDGQYHSQSGTYFSTSNRVTCLLPATQAETLNGGMGRTPDGYPSQWRNGQGRDHIDIPLNGGRGGTMDIPLTGGTGGTLDIPLNILFSSNFKLTEKYRFVLAVIF